MSHQCEENQGLLNALESLSAALSVVSSSVDMVREELQEVLSALYIQPPPVVASAPVVAAPSVEASPKPEHPPAIYLVDSPPANAARKSENHEEARLAMASPRA